MPDPVLLTSTYYMEITLLINSTQKRSTNKIANRPLRESESTHVSCSRDEYKDREPTSVGIRNAIEIR